MLKNLVIDIETIPHPDAHQWVDAPEPDGRLTDPVKIEADIKKKTLDRDEKFGLHPDTCCIATLGYHLVGGADPTCLVAKDEFEERELLRQFAEMYRNLNHRNEVRCITFYGSKFDLPVLMSRALWLDVKPFPKFNISRFGETSHARTDVWWVLSREGAVQAHSLKFYARRAGITTLDRVDGADIWQLVKNEDWAAVEAHCLSDVAITHVLAERLDLLK